MHIPSIDDKELYNTAVNVMIPLRQQVQRYLAETDWEQWESEADNYEATSDEFQINIEYARKMKAKGYPVEDIAEITDVNIDEIFCL